MDVASDLFPTCTFILELFPSESESDIAFASKQLGLQANSGMIGYVLCHFYRPQTKFAKVMFLHLSVILFTEGGEVSASVHAGIHTPWE